MEEKATGAAATERMKKLTPKDHGSFFSRLCSLYTVGLICLVFVVVFWSMSGFLTEKVLKVYNKPFMLTYLTNLSFLLYFVFLFVEDPVIKITRKRESKERLANPSTADEQLPPIPLGKLAKIAFVFFILYLSSNYAMAAAFGTTWVGSASILASTCGFFTLIFGWIVGVEILSFIRILAVLISVVGVLLVGIPEFSHSDTRTLGNVLALVSAIMYGIYSTFLKRVIIDESRLSMPLLFAFGGLYTLLFIWPVLLAFHYFEWETLALPPTEILHLIFLNIFLGGFIPNYLWNVSFVLTSPLVVAIGISFNIPLTLAIEYFQKGAFSWYRLSGGIIVVIGFILVNLATIYPEMDLALERRLAKAGIMKDEDVKSSEERAAKLRKELIQKNGL